MDNLTNKVLNITTLDNLEEVLNEISGINKVASDRDRPYDGQACTYLGERGKQEISGLTMRDLVDCMVKGMLLSSSKSAGFGDWTYEDLYKMDWDDVDPTAITQNAICCVEKMMGIYPNIPEDAK